MKVLHKIFKLGACFFVLLSYSQEYEKELNNDASPLSNITTILPKISIDSTSAEITEHVDAMIEWMTAEHYKSKYAPILIYAEKGLRLAERSNDKEHIHNTRSIIGNTLLRIKDTIGAKKLFSKSLKEAEKTNDSSLILKYKGNLANIYYYTEGYKQKTINIYLESISIAEKLKDTAKLFVLHHNLSRAYNEENNPELSGYHIKKTTYYLEQLNNPPHYKASHLHNKGRRLLLLNKPDEAINYFKETIAICKETEFTDALIEGYTGFKEALEMKNDYKGVYEVSKILEVYEKEKEKDEAQNIIESVSAKLKVESFKDQIKAKELEKELLEHQAESKTLLLFIVLAIVLFLFVLLVQAYKSNLKRKELIHHLKDKNHKYLEAKKHSDQLTQAKTKFFATVSHELRTPLYGVIGLSSILLESNELKQHEKDLKSLKFSANYLLALVNDLLHINKIESENFSEELSTFDLRELSSTIVSSFEYVRLQHQNKIDIKINKSVPDLLYGNSVRLSQVLMNLIGNACKFTEKGKITLEITNLNLQDDSVQLQFIVSDTGPGIEKEKLNQIFDEFTQIDSSATKYQGTGLGLPIVKKLIQQAGGEITVTSEAGKGSIFKFNLAFELRDKQENKNATQIVDFKKLAEKHILIVEDNRINQTVTKRILENENVQCMIAQNGEEAVQYVKENRFDLVLMDINMPVKNGIEATEEIRTFNADIPIIALTAVEIEEQKYRIFNCGMNDIVLKPYDIDKFKRTIILNLMAQKNEEIRQLA